MRIGITGAHSVGKTTLLNALRSEKQFKNYSICNEVTRWVKKFNISINEDGSDRSQELIMMKHVYNVYMHENMITDRISLDGIVYSDYLYTNNKLSLECFENAINVHNKIMKANSYNHIFFIEPEFPIEDDKVRSTDIIFQEEINKLFNQYILNQNIKVHKISGSVRERVNQVLEVVNG